MEPTIDLPIAFLAKDPFPLVMTLFGRPENQDSEP